MLLKDAYSFSNKCLRHVVFNESGNFVCAVTYTAVIRSIFSVIPSNVGLTYKSVFSLSSPTNLRPSRKVPATHGSLNNLGNKI